ncbi:inositol monophosphatase family protein [Pigmentibacter sp. JX0631]|uniref:inositol monophosphatase family protein n=1 Tax=Pigmentibacter sp. JX0631 TaxID=2976982 RepID=UPI0024689949|nr:inositol monophosphatase family protein [Pigmentibacter sp. JX0631]WGL60460.1 inositol monophosphatase family protein [Pigmentibacter sp. JX0631]
MSASQPTEAFITQIAQQAGEITLEYFAKRFKISEKSNNQGIVTEADLHSEKVIKAEIHNCFPSHSILAEESGLTEYAKKEDFEPIWIIDPLDGTTNFSKGNPYYCISIAFGFLKNRRFLCQLAAIYQPTTKTIFYAEKEKGAYCNGQKIQVSTLEELKMASICTGFSSNKGKDLVPLTKTIGEIQNNSLGLRINGAAALDLANTAKGMFQGFYETPLAPWDTAAGALLIIEAGGKVTNFQGNEFCPLQDRGIIAASSQIHESLFNLIKINYAN